MRRSGAGLVVALAFVAGLSLPASGVAKPLKLTYSHKTIPLEDTSNDSMSSVSCPAGTKVSGGGVYIPEALDGPEGLAHSVPGTIAAPNAPEQGWIGGGYNVTAPTSTLGITAICGPFGNKLSYVTKTTTTGEGDSTTFLAAKCPNGTDVIGGGVNLSGFSNGTQRIAASSPTPIGKAKPPTGWLGAAENIAGDPQMLTVTAICAKNLPQLHYAMNSATVGYQSSARLAATCPPGTKTVGGGGASTTTFDTHLKSSSPGTLLGGSAQPSKGWTASFQAAGDQSTVVVYAICMRART